MNIGMHVVIIETHHFATYKTDQTWVWNTLKNIVKYLGEKAVNFVYKLHLLAH